MTQGSAACPAGLSVMTRCGIFAPQRHAGGTPDTDRAPAAGPVGASALRHTSLCRQCVIAVPSSVDSDAHRPPIS